MKLNLTYANVHGVIKNSVANIRAFKPDVILAIGGGGFVPARILRSHIKIPILAVTLKLYNEDDTKGDEMVVVQWLDALAKAQIEGKRVLIVDEVDDTRTTLLACIAKLKETANPAAVGTFVLYNKSKKEKTGNFPEDVVSIVGVEVGDVWLNFPWEQCS